MGKIQSAERVSHADPSDNYVFQRSLLAYIEAAGIVGGDVLEIGTGSGYGVEVVSPSARTFTTVDKFDSGLDFSKRPNVRFLRMNVPPLAGIEDESYDYVITFQVIEHIRRDLEFLNEIYRVLRPGGKLIVSTPNKTMSLTRNPWHVREYTCNEFTDLTLTVFNDIQPLGVYGNDKVMEYYERNRESVRHFERYDIFRFSRWLPSFLLRIPYDILNRINRKKLLNADPELTGGITIGDYSIAPASDECFDLYYICTK